MIGSVQSFTITRDVASVAGSFAASQPYLTTSIAVKSIFCRTPVARIRQFQSRLIKSADEPFLFGHIQPALRVRIVAIRKSPQAAAQARRKARQAARKHGHTLSAATLEAADYVLILTTLTKTAADAAEILALYRLHWQIECAFKRLKSLLHLDALRAFDADLARTYLFAKLLGAVLVDAIRSAGPAFPPYGYPIRSDIQRRVAYFADNLGGVAGYGSGPPGSRRLGRQRTGVDQSPV